MRTNKQTNKQTNKKANKQQPFVNRVACICCCVAGEIQHNLDSADTALSDKQTHIMTPPTHTHVHTQARAHNISL